VKQLHKNDSVRCFIWRLKMLPLVFSFCICTVPEFWATDVAQQPGSIPAHAFPEDQTAGEPLKQVPDCLQNRVE
jgi:hypothetical protein